MADQKQIFSLKFDNPDRFIFLSHCCFEKMSSKFRFQFWYVMSKMYLRNNADPTLFNFVECLWKSWKMNSRRTNRFSSTQPHKQPGATIWSPKLLSFVDEWLNGWVLHHYNWERLHNKEVTVNLTSYPELAWVTQW